MYGQLYEPLYLLLLWHLFLYEPQAPPEEEIPLPPFNFQFDNSIVKPEKSTAEK